MDAISYAKITNLCGRLGGRLSDPVLDAVRVYYFVGEGGLAEGTLLIGLVAEDVGITQSELELIRAFVADAATDEVGQLRVVSELPPSTHQFCPEAPATAPDPSRADEVLATEAERHRVRSLHRAWRGPQDDSPTGTWLYVALVDADRDVLGVYSGLSSRLGATLRLAWPLEVMSHDQEPTSYQGDALAAASPVWAR